MRSKMSSEPNLYGNKFVRSKPFSPIKRSSAHKGPSMSNKLSSKVKRLLSEDLNKTCPSSPSYASSSALASASASASALRSPSSLYTGDANQRFVCGDDASIQSTNSRKRRFQRRGSKSASMFKSFSIDEFLFEGNGDRLAAIKQNVCIPKVSERSCLSGLGESTNTLSLHEISEDFGCSSEEFGC